MIRDIEESPQTDSEYHVNSPQLKNNNILW